MAGGRQKVVLPLGWCALNLGIGASDDLPTLTVMQQHKELHGYSAPAPLQITVPWNAELFPVLGMPFPLLFVSVSSGCHNKVPQMGWFRRQKLGFHNSGGWEVQDQGASRFSSCWKPSSWLAARHLLAVSSHSNERERALVSLPLLTKTLIPWREPHSYDLI